MTDCPTLLGILRNANISLLQSQGNLSTLVTQILLDQATAVQVDFPNQPATADSRGVWSLRDVDARLAALRASVPVNQQAVAIYVKLDSEGQSYLSALADVETKQAAYNTALKNAQDAGCIGGKGTGQ